jgi:hypothetical protein
MKYLRSYEFIVWVLILWKTKFKMSASYSRIEQ